MAAGKKTIAYVGGESGAGTSLTPPAHIEGDLFVVFAYRSSSSYATVPGDFTEVGTVTRADGSCKIAVKVAASASETVTGFTNATALILVVYRNCDASDPIGAVSTGSGLGTTLTYPALTLDESDETSVTLAYGAANDNEVALDARTGFTDREAVSATGFECRVSDVSGGTSFGTDAEALGLSVPWVAAMVELRADVESSVLFWAFP